MHLKNILAVFVFLILIFFISCTDETKPDDVIVVRGKVLNSSYSKISLKFNDELVFSEIDSADNFEFSIDSQTPLFMRLQLGERGLPLYSEPGNIDSIFCIEEFSKSLQFSGDNGMVNKYLLSKILNYEAELRLLPQYYCLDALSFIAKMDSLELIFYSDFEKLKRSALLTKKFIELEAAQIKYKFANLKLTFADGHKYFAKKENVYLPQDYHGFMQKLDLNNPNLLTSPEFLKFVNRYLNEKVKSYMLDLEQEQDGELHFEKLKMKLIPVLFSNEKIIEKLLYDEMKSILEESHSYKVTELFDHYNSLSGSTQNKKKVSTLYLQWKGLTKGKPAPGFAYSDIEGECKSLKDFRGNYVVLDIWAAWCNPCKKEFPLIKEMAVKYREKEILFISISVDDEREKWEKALQNYDLEGIQLIADNGWESSIIKDYNIHTIPRFILIDKEGNIINTDAPSPTRGLSKLLDELI